MSNIRNMFSLKIICTAIMLSVFSLNAVNPPTNSKYLISEAVMVYRVKTIKDKIQDFNPKSSLKDVVDTMLEIKYQYVQQTSKRSSVHEDLSVVKNHMKSRGKSLDKKTWKALEKLIEKREQKFTTRLFYKDFATYTGIEFNEAQFEDFYEKNYEKEKFVQEDPLSLEVTIGVTLVLSGVFLMSLPIPFCATTGAVFIEIGFGFLGSEGWPYFKEWCTQ